ncbi:DHH family phosphoesterase [Winogradskyella aurantia]|uniref:DHH family phosphoesterase n=1 Tax=Winogradskyella aurantia TaxID=1915063 RepID=A0A265UXN5_9FLAO|nr:bifunctional oligoribonuclease/PAP phosphatase NrnA [Winogradskyella aurantia]OZV70069.1 DHH family phosphoesterase [Winogradskyella aurantia]
MIKAQIPEIKRLLSSPKNIVIIPHKNPDGDAMGSSLGLYQFLDIFQHHTKVIAPNDYPDFLKWLPNEEKVLKFDMQTEECLKSIEKADVIFTLDFNALQRAGHQLKEVLEKSNAIKFMIDHHQQPDDYAQYMYSDVHMSSTSEMVYNLIEMLGYTNKIDAVIATCLYAGIMTDTGSFRFPSTTSTTHRVIADLIEKGADNSEIHNSVYDTNSYARLQLLGRAMQNLKIIPEYKTAYISLSQDELNAFDFKKGDTEGFVNYALSLEGVIFAAIFIENQQESIIKISFRSKGSFSVNEFAREHFNGGGHINAAGGRSTTDLKSTIDKFISILPHYKTELSQK